MDKPATVQELLDWINSYMAQTARRTEDIYQAEAILVACRAYLEALEKKP